MYIIDKKNNANLDVSERIEKNLKGKKLLQLVMTGDVGYLFALLVLFHGEKEAVADYALPKLEALGKKGFSVDYFQKIFQKWQEKTSQKEG